MVVLLSSREVNWVSSTADPILGRAEGRTNGVNIGRMCTSQILGGFFPIGFGRWGIICKILPFSLKKPRTAHIVIHLISVAVFITRSITVFLSREKPENPRTVTMPGFHYVDHSSDITSNDRNYSNVEQQEISKARLSPLACVTSRMSTIVGLRS